MYVAHHHRHYVTPRHHVTSRHHYRTYSPRRVYTHGHRRAYY
jgi:hypothetical protein